MMHSSALSSATVPPLLSTPQQACASLLAGASARVSADLHGFGGLHGGIGLAVAMRAILDDGFEASHLRSLHARYERTIRDELSVTVTGRERRHTVASAVADVTSNSHRCVVAAATFGRSTIDTAPCAPTMPAASGRPTDHDEFAMPPEFVPFGRFIEIRPTIPERPFAGDDTPHLAAWIRLRDDDTPVDLLRLVILLDALAPSAAAPMTDFFAVPTVELTIRPTPVAHETTSPWILLDAHSNVSNDGWIDETLTAWTPDGSHLASASQLRVARSLR